MTFSKYLTGLFLFLFISSTSVFGQGTNEVSNEELQQFASALQQIQTVNKRSQQKMANAVMEEDISVERFKEITQAQQSEGMEVKATDSELKKYQSAVQAVQAIQTQAQQMMEQKIVSQGLTVNRYQEIATNVQSNKALQQRLQEYFPG